jgi:AcrR family transcriptional regulator
LSAADGVPRRADGRRNRQRVLEAAEALFAERGGCVRIEEVAERAGVGVGTVCRNFPTKEGLVAAVLEVMLDTLLDRARDALAEPDPARALESFVIAMAEVQSRHRILAEQMAADFELPGASSERRAELRAAMAEVMGRAQAAGLVRRDLGPLDLAMLIGGVASVAGRETELRDRYVRIVLDGLCPATPHPLPGRAVTVDEVGRILRPRRPGNPPSVPEAVGDTGAAR